MSKNLTFKLILDADSKGFVSGVKQSESVAKSVFEAIKTESDKLRQSSAEAAKEIGNIIPKGTSELAAGLTKSLSSATEIIKDAGENAKSTAGNFTDFGNKSHKALDLLKADLTSAKQKLQEFANSNASPADIEVAQRQVDQLEKEVQQADQAFNDFQAEVGRANTQLKETDSAATSAKKGLDGAKFAVNALVGAMAALGVGLGVRELAEAADAYTGLSARIQIATKEGGNFESAMAGVHQVALATNSSLQATGDLFTRIDAVGKEMGMTQQQALDLTKTVTQAIQIGGGSAQASEAAITQFIQAMQGGVLRGEEFNSIMENGYGLAEALAKGLGVTTGELRKMAENGELTSERVAKALQSQAAQVQSTYDQFPTTIGNALTKIATQWQILIGTMDQAHGASSVVAEALSTIADNLGILKVFFDDVAEGVGWFRDKLAEIDPATIDAVRSALSDAYDVVKNLIKSMAGIAETAWSAFTSTLDAISPLFNAMLSGQQNVSGLTTLFNVFRVALGVVSDAATGLNIGLKLLLSGLQFLAGGLTALQAKVLDFIGFDTLAKQAQDASDRLFAQAEKNAKEANRLALESKSATVAALEDIRKTDEEKNQERIANSQKTLSELKAQEEKHRADYKAISDERIKLEQQLHEARKTGNQAAIDLAVKGLAELDAKEKAYQAESQKITEAKIQAAQVVASAMIKSADAAGMAQLKVLNAQLAAQGLQAEFDSTGKVIVKAMDDGAKATENQGNATDKARKAAAALGLDLDVSLNRVSAKFKESEGQLNNFTAGLDELGITGEQAGDVTFQAWQKWAEQAKSQAEIDIAKAKLIEFEEQGVFSAKQVQMGMEYLDQVNGKLPDNISEVEKAYRLLGIASREEASKIADAQMKAFNVLKQSGTATAEQLKQALINMSDKIYASGDAAKISWYEGQLAANNLEASIDSTGKASVKAMDDLTKANERVADSVGQIGNAYQNVGDIVRDEANAAQVEWNKVAQAAQDAWNADMKRQGKGLSAAISGYQSMSKNDVISQIKSMGYSEDQAKKLAGSIWSQGLSADRDAKFAAYGKGGNLAMNKLIEQEFNNAAAKGLTTQHGTNKINELLRNLDVRSTGSVPKVNDYAPNISEPKIRDLQNDAPTKNVRFEFVSGGKRFEMQGSQEDGDMMESILREFEMLKKAM